MLQLTKRARILEAYFEELQLGKECLVQINQRSEIDIAQVSYDKYSSHLTCARDFRPNKY